MYICSFCSELVEAHMMHLCQATMVVSDKGGYQFIEDYCGYHPGGNGFHYGARLITFEEELMSLELGHRVANEFIGLAIESWGALMDAIYNEYVMKGGE